MIGRLNWMADRSQNGLTQSEGIMVLSLSWTILFFFQFCWLWCLHPINNLKLNNFLLPGWQGLSRSHIYMNDELKSDRSIWKYIMGLFTKMAIYTEPLIGNHFRLWRSNLLLISEATLRIHMFYILYIWYSAARINIIKAKKKKKVA